MKIYFKDESGIECMVKNTAETAPNWEMFVKDDCDNKFHFSHEVTPEKIVLIVAKQVCGYYPK